MFDNRGMLTIIGEPPGLLMNTDVNMKSSGAGKKNEAQPSLEEMVLGSRYLMPDHLKQFDGELCIWATHIMGALKMASSNYKIKAGRMTSLKPFLSGLVYFPEEYISLNTADHEPDYRTVVNKQKGRLRIGRAKVFPWQVTTLVEFDSFLLKFMKESFTDLVTDAGRMCGILDFRPNKGGPFGRFRLSEWVIEDRVVYPEDVKQR